MIDVLRTKKHHIDADDSLSRTRALHLADSLMLAQNPDNAQNPALRIKACKRLWVLKK